MRCSVARLAVSAVLVTSALLAASAPGASAGETGTSRRSAAQAATTTTATTAPQLRIGSYNFEAFRPLDTFIASMKRYKRHVDIAGLQEIGMTSRTKWLLKDHAWGYYRPPALQQNPIIWRRSVFDFVSAKGIKIANGRDLGNENPTTKDVKRDTYATIVHLREVTSGKQIAFINVHLMHGAIKRTDPYPGRPRTYRLYLAQLRGLIQAVEAQQAKPANTGGVYVTGDFNISYRPDAEDKKANLPYASMRRIGMRSVWAHSWQLSHNRGTLGTGLFDEVWHSGPPTGADILTTIKGSDHYPIVATYDLPTADPSYVPPGGAAGFVQQPVEGAEYYSQQFMKFPITGNFDVGWVQVRQVPDAGPDVAQLGSDFVVDDASLQPGSSYILVRALADGNLQEPSLEHFTLELVPYGGATIPSDQTTVEGFINASDKK
jgi:hypothetical protein